MVLEDEPRQTTGNEYGSRVGLDCCLRDADSSCNMRLRFIQQYIIARVLRGCICGYGLALLHGMTMGWGRLSWLRALTVA